MSSTWLVWLVAAKAVFEGTVQYRSHCTDMYMIILRYGLQGTDLHVVSHNHRSLCSLPGTMVLCMPPWGPQPSQVSLSNPVKLHDMHAWQEEGP